MKNHVHDVLSRIVFREASAPLAFLAALVASFGLLIPKLGIYQDDWLFVYNAFARGTDGLREFLYYDGSPFAVFLNVSLFSLLGFNPLFWHIAALVARWLTVVAFWLVLRSLWPEHPRQNFFAALIFAVHPFFILQPMAFTFLHVWISYILMGLSLYWMIRSVQEPKRFWWFTALSLVAEAVVIITGEYFAGLEFLRPVLLWMALTGREPDAKKRIFKALQLWIPYLLVFGAYMYWRFFIYEVPIKNRNVPVTLTLLFSEPMTGIRTIVYNLIPDSLLIVFTSWYQVLDPFDFNFTDRTNLGLFGLAALGAALAFFYFSRQRFTREVEEPASRWVAPAFWLGLAIVVFGLIPPYVGGYFINQKNFLWNSRFGMASMLGASMIVVALIELLIRSPRARMILLALMVGLSAAWHMRYTNDFRWAWAKQENLFRQLVLRIPALQPDTALVAEGEILPLMGDYPTAYAINALYAQPDGDSGERINYWFFGITTNFSTRQEEFMQGMDIQDRHRSVTFKGRSDESLIIAFEPERGQCLWVLRPADSIVRFMPPLPKQAAHLSDLSRIQTSAQPNAFLDQVLELSYPEDWCTFYTQADLARQNSDWQTVTRLWESAQAKGFAPENGYEYLPFIEAYARLGDWDQAVAITLIAGDAPPSTRYTLCDFWDQLPASPERDASIETLQPELGCSGD